MIRKFWKYLTEQAKQKQRKVRGQLSLKRHKFYLDLAAKADATNLPWEWKTEVDRKRERPDLKHMGPLHNEVSHVESGGRVYYIQYYCPHCDGKLTNGPAGGNAPNQVCESCKINFGTLPYTAD